MSIYETTFNGVFFLSLGTICCAGIGVILGFCFKSKCNEFRLCSSDGLVHIVRDVTAENDETKMELEHIPNRIPDNNIV